MQTQGGTGLARESVAVRRLSAACFCVENRAVPSHKERAAGRRAARSLGLALRGPHCGHHFSHECHRHSLRPRVPISSGARNTGRASFACSASL